MNCERFALWLDDGRPEEGAGPARAHARDCARCARALDAALELEAALAVLPPAPAGFTDRVMARVAATPQERALPAALAAAAPLLPAPFEWWVRAAMEPSVLLALLLAAVLVRYFGAIVQGVAAMRGAFDTALGALATRPAFDAATVAGFCLPLLPALLWASWRMYRWAESLGARSGSGLGRLAP